VTPPVAGRNIRNTHWAAAAVGIPTLLKTESRSGAELVGCWRTVFEADFLLVATGFGQSAARRRRWRPSGRSQAQMQQALEPDLVTTSEQSHEVAVGAVVNGFGRRVC